MQMNFLRFGAKNKWESNPAPGAGGLRGRGAPGGAEGSPGGPASRRPSNRKEETAVDQEEWDVEFAAEILRRENEGQVTKPHKGRFDQKERKPKIEENSSKQE